MSQYDTGWVYVLDNEETIVTIPAGVITEVKVRWKGVDRDYSYTSTTSQAYGGTFYETLTGYMTAPDHDGDLTKVSASISMSWGESGSWSITLTPSGGPSDSNGGTGTSGSNSATGYVPTLPRALASMAVGIDSILVNYSGSVTAYWEEEGTYHTVNPKITVNTFVTQHTGTLSNGVESAWYDCTGDFNVGANTVRHDSDDSDRAYVQIIVTYIGSIYIASAEPQPYAAVARDQLKFVLTQAVPTGNTATVYWPKIQAAQSVGMSPIVYTWDSSSSQTNWEYSANGTDWTAMTSGGIPVASLYARFTPPSDIALGRWWWQATIKDDYAGVFDSWFAVRQLRVSLSMVTRFAVEIAGLDYSSQVKNPIVSETTNGELGTMEFDLWVADELAGTPGDGDSVVVSVRDISGQEESYEGWLQGDPERAGPREFKCYCKLPDSILAERIILENYTTADVGATLASIVDEYCAPLDSSGIDTATGFSRPITAFGKTPLEIFKEVREQYGLIFWVDSPSFVVFLVNPDDLDPPLLTVTRGQAGDN